MSIENENLNETEESVLNIADVMRSNYDLLLSDMGGDEQKTRVCLKYMTWLIKDIEIFKDVDLKHYKDIWEGAFNHYCA